MKITLKKNRRPQGFILLLVLMLAAFSVIILAGVMNRTSTVALLNMRSVKLNALDSAAEAAVEKALARMAWDFQQYGPGQVTSYLSTYRALVPSGSDNAYWSNFSFSDPVSGTVGALYCDYVTNYTGSLPLQFTNQFAYNSPIYRIACNVKNTNSLGADVIGTAQEDILLALVPITTYAIFYNGQLEFSGCAPMTVNGRVHANTNICVGAGGTSTLTFNSKVTAVATLSAPNRAIWSWTEFDPTTWRTTFGVPYVTNSPLVSLAIQMTNTHSIIEIPPAGEIVMSQLGQVRLYNQAQVVLIVTNSPFGNWPQINLRLQTAYNGTLPGGDGSPFNKVLTNIAEGIFVDVANTNTVVSMSFLSLTNTFTDLRQFQTNQFITQINVGQLATWLTSDARVVGKFSAGSGLYPTILYVADQRNLGTNKQSAIRLVNVQKLPYNNGLGFSVASQNPVYVKGDYNTTINGTNFATTLGSTTNGASVPAAILSDAITILSPSWLDANSAADFSSRAASSMSFNAAIVTGNVPSTGTGNTQFSGGVHNITRLLEDWSNDTLTLNTSIVVLYASKIGTNQWQVQHNGNASGYYDPPTRNWGFDTTYYSPNKQPPGVPCALVPIRFNWSKPPPGGLASY